MKFFKLSYRQRILFAFIYALLVIYGGLRDGWDEFTIEKAISSFLIAVLITIFTKWQLDKEYKLYLKKSQLEKVKSILASFGFKIEKEQKDKSVYVKGTGFLSPRITLKSTEHNLILETNEKFLKQIEEHLKSE